MEDLECPYCGEGNDVCHDDGAGYAEEEAHEMECDKCEKTFTFQTHISFSYYPEKADCLNDGNHQLTTWCRLWVNEGEITEQRNCMTCEHKERRTRTFIL